MLKMIFGNMQKQVKVKIRVNYAWLHIDIVKPHVGVKFQMNPND